MGKTKEKKAEPAKKNNLITKDRDVFGVRGCKKM